MVEEFCMIALEHISTEKAGSGESLVGPLLLLDLNYLLQPLHVQLQSQGLVLLPIKILGVSIKRTILTNVSIKWSPFPGED